MSIGPSGGGVQNDTAGWIELNLSELASEDGTPIPFRLLANRWKSSSPDSEGVIHDPLTRFLEARETVDGFRAVERDWHVTTFVVNHHRTLSVSHTYGMAVVDPRDRTVGLTLVKRAP
jgi:hypothetical protein